MHCPGSNPSATSYKILDLGQVTYVLRAVFVLICENGHEYRPAVGL